MNKLIISALLMVGFVGMIGTATAEDSLDTILNTKYGTGNWEEIYSYAFNSGGYEVITIIRDQQSGYKNPIGWYDQSDIDKNELLFANDGITTSVTFNPSVHFGMYIDSGDGNRYYTEQGNNIDDFQHAKVFRVDTNDDGTKDAFVVAFEDLKDGGDKDYQDVVLQLKGEGLSAIPEFPTIALPIAAVLGLMFIISSRKKKE